VTDPVLHLTDVSYRWPGRVPFSIDVPNFVIAKGETVLLLGESGSGKSTLLSLICGTILPDRGIIRIAGTDFSSMAGGARDRLRAEKIGVIFQQFNLLPFGTVMDNILLPLRFAPDRRKRVANPAQKAAELCAALGLPDGVERTKTTGLSVGQQQRVAVARAMIGQPPLIVADEPTSALDANSQAAFLNLMFAQARTNSTSLLMVSHDPRLADRFDRVVEIDDIAHIERATL